MSTPRELPPDTTCATLIRVLDVPPSDLRFLKREHGTLGLEADHHRDAAKSLRQSEVSRGVLIVLAAGGYGPTYRKLFGKRMTQYPTSICD